jgi:LytS/YehU family sensor histidine kinase
LPDNYYTVFIYSDDDARITDVQKFTIYISPKWWQTNFAKKMLFSGGILLTILIIMLSVYITKRIVLRAQFRKNLQMEMELKSIHAQINPHFIFNTLNSALLLVSNKKMDEAYTHISRFSKLLRAYLKSSRNKYITIDEEVNNLKNYLDLQQTRFKDKFTYDLIVAEEISQDLVKIPTLLIQPFAENAINHGILPKDGNGILKIEFRSKIKAGILQCIIDDDGVGRKKSKENNSLLGKNESYGDLLINDLIDIFNRYEDIKIDIVYFDKEPPLTGTTVTINIKNIKYD